MRNGFRVEKDIQRGLKLLGESADWNDPDACFYMGFLYLSVCGVQKNLEIIAKWYKAVFYVEGDIVYIDAVVDGCRDHSKS